jgi:hypothetical protein
MGTLADRWRPWRAVAARMLWSYYRALKQREGAPNATTSTATTATAAAAPAALQRTIPIVKPKATRARRANA